MRRPLLLAHRGARLCAPENTLAAFDQALTRGCNGFEFDVRRSADGRGLVCHDPSLRSLKIAAHSYAEISKRDAQLCSVEEVLARYADRAFLDIELKDPGLEDLVVDLLRQYAPTRGHVVSSFLPEVITAVHKKDAAVPLGFICDQRARLQQWKQLPISHLIPRHNLVSRELVEQLHAAGRKVFVWTVNNPREMLRLAEWGVDALISDDTELLCRTFARH